MKSKSTNFIIRLNIYPFDIMVSINESNRKLKQTLIESGINITNEINKILIQKKSNDGLYIMFDSNQSLIRLKNWPQSPKDFNTICHEALHATTFILDKVGIPFDLNKNDEAYAYLLGYITEQIYANTQI